MTLEPIMQLPLLKLNYTFTKKPLLVGGMAMEYYDLRKSGEDIDLIAPEQDIIELIKLYPERVKNLYSDLGVCPFEFEIWRSIQLLKYDDLIDGAIEENNCFVISLKMLLLMKALAMSKEKYLNDTKLVAKRINDEQYKNYSYEKSNVDKLLEPFKNITYIEKFDG